MKYLRTFLSCLLAIIAIHANASDFTVDGIDYAITSTTDLTVKVEQVEFGDDEFETTITIPSTVVFNKKTYRVTGISGYAFRDLQYLVSVYMPSITYIESADFYGDRDDYGVFCGCKNLKHVDMPSVITIGEYAFANTDIESISLPLASSIGANAFYESDIDSLCLPAASAIGAKAFASSSIDSISLPAAISISDSAFYLSRLEYVNIPMAISIGKAAFSKCYLLRGVSMPAAKYIGDYAFQESSLSTKPEDLNMPAAITIGKHAFEGSGIKIVSMPVATSICDSAFKDCLLRSVSMPAVKQIGESVFNCCYYLQNNLSLPAATFIGNNAFAYCSLKGLSLPAATFIGGGAFGGCSALKDFSLPAATFIGDGAFSDCLSLDSVYLPVTKSIGGWTFYHCDNLETVNMPKVTTIGDQAFMYCFYLKEIVIPSIKSIGKEAFYGCDYPNEYYLITDIFVGYEPASFPVSYPDEEFEEETYYRATLHVPAGCASKYKAANIWCNFRQISEGYNPTGIKSTEVNDVKIHTDNGYVQLTGLKDGEKVEFYAIDGKLIGAQKASGSTVSIATSEHVVICKMGGASIKILVKK